MATFRDKKQVLYGIFQCS